MTDSACGGFFDPRSIEQPMFKFAIVLTATSLLALAIIPS
jgi:hypothetical protein